MTIKKRALLPLVLQDLKDFPAVYINGPRQAGKSTLVRELILPQIDKGGAKTNGKKPKTVNPALRYITFDDLLERESASRNPTAFLESCGTPVILDEVQMVPQLYRPIKKAIDEARLEKLQAGRAKPNGRYLLTGSANLAAVPALANAMVGRMAVRTLYPFATAEIWGGKGDFIARAFAGNFVTFKQDKHSITAAIDIATFPELSGMAASAVKSWLDNYVRKVTLDDPRQIYNLEKAEYMPRLLLALASRAGNLINDTDLSRDIGLSSITTRTYRHLLQNSFIALELPPWHRNTNKRLVKASKGYFYDTRLLCHLLQRPPHELAKHDPARFGHVLENFVATELLKLINNSGGEHQLLFYRTRDGREVDFVIENSKGQIIGIEVKYAETITEKDLQGIKELQQVAGKDFGAGYVLCNTPRALPFGDNITLLPFQALWD